MPATRCSSVVSKHAALAQYQWLCGVPTRGPQLLLTLVHNLNKLELHWRWCVGGIVGM
jgi:hypothetical protein